MFERTRRNAREVYSLPTRGAKSVRFLRFPHKLTHLSRTQPLEYYLSTEEVPPGGVGPCHLGQHLRVLRQHSPHPLNQVSTPTETSTMQEAGQMELRRFCGPIGRRSALHYGMNPRDARI